MSTEHERTSLRKVGLFSLSTVSFCLSRSAFCLLLLLRALYRIACVLPGRQTAQQGRRVVHSFALEIQHRTGARVFGRSSTVSNDRLISRELIDLLENLPLGNQDRALYAALFEGRFRTRIDDQSFSFFP